MQEFGPTLKRHHLTALPPYLILHIKRFTKNNFVEERNPTVVNFPLRGVELSDCESTHDAIFYNQLIALRRRPEAIRSNALGLRPLVECHPRVHYRINHVDRYRSRSQQKELERRESSSMEDPYESWSGWWR